MLDIKFIRQNVDMVKDAARKKHVTIDINRLIVLDDERLGLLQQIEEKHALQNNASKEISSLADTVLKIQKIDEMKIVKTEMQALEDKLKPIQEEWDALMLRIPNIPDLSVPEGDSDVDNVEIKVWGQKPAFDFEPKDHIELMLERGMVDFERGTKAHGFRGYYLIGWGARLSFALWNYALDFYSQKDFLPFLPPAIVKEKNFFGTGHLPADVDDAYRTQDNDGLIATSEISLMGFHADEMLSIEELPKRYMGFSPCYRREVGSYSKDVKGLIRVNEFYKWEQLILCEANHELSAQLHEELNRNTEEFIESLGIPYHTIVACGGDLGRGHVKMYDVELWVPKENKYREIGSASYFHDFQTRRCNIRYKDKDGKVFFAHSLNATAVATPRILVSLIENFQQADGSIAIPEVLRPYLGGADQI